MSFTGFVCIGYAPLLSSFPTCHHLGNQNFIVSPVMLIWVLWTIIWIRCVITGNGGTSYSYLGRPWGPFGRVVFAYTWMDACIKPDGWNNWNKPENERSACFYEFRYLLALNWQFLAFTKWIFQQVLQWPENKKHRSISQISQIASLIKFLKLLLKEKRKRRRRRKKKKEGWLGQALCIDWLVASVLKENPLHLFFIKKQNVFLCPR